MIKEDIVLVLLVGVVGKLIFSPVGAYNNTQWLQFIEYRPNVVLISEAGEVELIRQREDLSDIERREVLPTRLMPNRDEAAFIEELAREA